MGGPDVLIVDWDELSTLPEDIRERMTQLVAGVDFGPAPDPHVIWVLETHPLLAEFREMLGEEAVHTYPARIPMPPEIKFVGDDVICAGPRGYDWEAANQAPRSARRRK